MYVIWLMASIVFLGLAGYARAAHRPVRFWNVTKDIQVRDIHKYNRAVARMWTVFAAVVAVIGLPLLFAGQNSAWAVIPILGGMASAIALMVLYSGIEKTYRIF